jgi:hypothetical protein
MALNLWKVLLGIQVVFFRLGPSLGLNIMWRVVVVILEDLICQNIFIN